MYLPFETFLFRTPYFPFSTLVDFEAKQHESVFKEMLQIATPDLSESMEKGAERAQHSAYRYYQRACTRPTPFGLFAGCSMGHAGDCTDICLTEQERYQRVTRLDMNYICALIQQIEKDKSIREQLIFYPNSSMYHAGGDLRYVAFHYRKTIRTHQIKRVEISVYLKKVMDRSCDGVRFSDLVEALVDDEVTADVAKVFLHDLIDMQVLISELEPAVTNVQPLRTLIAKLNGLTNTNSKIIGILSEIDAQLAAIDAHPIGTTGEIYTGIIQNIQKTAVSTEIKYLFQTDMYKPALHATVSRGVLKDIQQALIFLNKITTPATITHLSQFKESFTKRYEEREMPLLFVLDNELGIGYAGNNMGDISPLVDDLVISGRTSPSYTSVQSIIIQKYQSFTQKNIELTDEDVKGIDAIWDDLPPTFSTICQILQDDDQGRSIYIQSTGGHSAANLLGRFCHLDEKILKHTLDITERETQLNPDVIFAEIVHLPESRIGNVLIRPILRPYEIPYLAKTGVTSEFELKPDDLYVSVKNNRVVLRSKRWNREIIPRMSNAHNFSGQNPMPVYHFLCDMQHQNGRTGFGFFWNEMAKQLDYLPRIVYKNCILAQARWTVREKEIKAFTGIKSNDDLLLKVKEWQSLRNLPDTILLADSDNELLIDLTQPLSIRAWLSVVKKRSLFYLEEFLFDPKTAVVHSQEGVFTNEFIFSFYKETRT